MSENSSNEKPTFLSNALLQIIPVMIGVFLGLWANNWSEDRKQIKMETQVLQRIKQDIESNKKQLENVIDYHRSLSDSVKVIMEKGDFEILQKTRLEIGRDNPYSIWEGTRTGRLRDAGYQTAIVTGVLAELDFEMVSLLSEIHQDELNYANMSNNYLQTAINMDVETRLIDQILFVNSFSIDITYVEEDLIRLYDLTLEKMKAIN